MKVVCGICEKEKEVRLLGFPALGEEMLVCRECAEEQGYDEWDEEEVLVQYGVEE